MVRKLFVAVHGIGDQREFDTAQHVVKQVLRSASTSTNRGKDYGPHISLGNFSSGGSGSALSPTTTTTVYWHQDTGLGFSEIHWADLCRQPEHQGFRLEPAVPWSQTLVDKVKSLKDAANLIKKTKASDPDFELIRTVIGEMGEGLQLIGWLTRFAPQLQLPTFETDKIVSEYLGDVQFVAEFADIRKQILARFHETMQGVFQTAQLRDGDEIYLIAHSEGTVVTLLGLLEAMSEEKRPVWLNHVRGWMTIGSPIDKHLILWPDLWKPFEKGPAPGQYQWVSPIVWWNYADYGDPIGFELDSMRAWMQQDRENGRWSDRFQFCDGQKNNECIFSRYSWPGQAHLDYWTDNDLFDHFLGTVSGIKSKSDGKPIPVPACRPWSRRWSISVPYILAFLVLLAGVYFLEVGIWAVQKLPPDPWQFSQEVIAITALLAGTTVLARIPRIVREKVLSITFSVGVFLIFASFFVFFLPSSTITWLSAHLIPIDSTQAKMPVPELIATTLPKSDTMVAIREVGAKFLMIGMSFWVGLNAIFTQTRGWRQMTKMLCYSAILILIVVTGVIMWRDAPAVRAQTAGLTAILFSFVATMMWSVWETREGHSAGLWPLIAPTMSFLVVTGIVLALTAHESPSTAQKVHVSAEVSQGKTDNDTKTPVWPFVIGTVAFLMFWRLAAILFDLVFVWHLYIRNNRMMYWFRNNIEYPDSGVTWAGLEQKRSNQ